MSRLITRVLLDSPLSVYRLTQIEQRVVVFVLLGGAREPFTGVLRGTDSLLPSRVRRTLLQSVVTEISVLESKV